MLAVTTLIVQSLFRCDSTTPAGNEKRISEHFFIFYETDKLHIFDTNTTKNFTTYNPCTTVTQKDLCPESLVWSLVTCLVQNPEQLLD
jgi:hypothetical protein